MTLAATDPRLPAELTHTAAAIPFAIGAAIIGVGAVLALLHGGRAGSSLANHISLGLEFLLAAGLLRLASTGQLEMLGLVAAIIVTRKIIGIGIRSGARAWG